MSFDIIALRTALIITLSILLVYLLARRLKQRTLRDDLPAIGHAELLSLEVVYHPSRLSLLLELPDGQLIHTTLLDERHQVKFSWPEGRLEKGVHAIERPLPPLANGTYYLEVSTGTQRTVRQFRLL